MTFPLTGILPSASGGTFSLTFAVNTSNAANAASFNFTGLNFGSGGGAGDVVYIVAVVCATGTNQSMSRVQIGGIAATTAVVSGTTNVGQVGIFYVQTSLLTGNVSGVLGPSARADVATYRMLNPGSSGTPFATANSTTIVSGTNVNLSLNVPTGGAACAGVQTRNASGWNTWIGLTQRYATSIGDQLSGASGTATGTPLTVTGEATGSPTNIAGSSASWGP